jgi:hypothetical protein
MGRTTLDRATCVRLGVIATVGAGGLAAGAALSWFALAPAVPDLRPSAPQQPPVASGEGSRQGTAGAPRLDDAEGTAERLALAHSWGPGPSDAGSKPDTSGEIPPEWDEPRPGEWTYLGSLLGGGRRAAIVAVDGRQHIIFEGERLGDRTLVQVGNQMVLVRPDSGAPLRIFKPERDGRLVSDLVATSVKSSPAVVVADDGRIVTTGSQPQTRTFPPGDPRGDRAARLEAFQGRARPPTAPAPGNQSGSQE